MAVAVVVQILLAVGEVNCLAAGQVVLKACPEFPFNGMAQVAEDAQ